MPSTPISDDELAVVARVVSREGWRDLSSPPESHPPRTLDEERAVTRFGAAAPRARRSPRAARIRARLTIVALSVGVIGACWWVSPTRTAIALIGAGLFSLVALQRRGARAPARARRPAGPLPFSGRVRAR